MNCKPGDLAVTMGSDPGMLVEVIRSATPADVVEWEPGAWWCLSLGGPIKTFMSSGAVSGLSERPIRDSDLRPIRDQPGADETLTWAPVPVSKPEPVAA